MPVTQRTLEREAARLCRLLALDSWSIEVRFVEQAALAQPARTAEVDIYSTHRQADIRVLRPDLPNPVGCAPRCWLSDLVHELLELHMHDVTEAQCGHDQEVAKERAINHIAAAIIALRAKEETT